MPESSHPQAREQPENLVRRLAAKLRHHVLWDALFIAVPPVAAAGYGIWLLLQTARLGGGGAIFGAAIVAVAGSYAIVRRYRPFVPTISAVARMIDQRAGTKDHFLTLSTLDGGACPPSFWSRLQRDTADFVARVEPRRDFPYRLKRSAYWSAGLSIVVAVLLQFLLPLALPVAHSGALEVRLHELARELAARPGLRALARELDAVAAKLDDPKMTQQEKQALAQQLEKKIEEQQKKEEQKDNRDLLGQAAGALEGIEQQQVASGQEQQKDQQKGAGGIQSNLPQKGEGESKQNQGGDGKGDSTAQLSTDLQQGKSGQGNPKEPGSEKNQQQAGSEKNDQPDPNRPGQEQKKEQLGKTQGGSKEGAGREKASEEPPPQGSPPAERFYSSGEGKEGIKGAGYVTVQLPEEIAADAKGENRATKDSKSGRTRTQVPVSNAPLPAHVPNAPTEKQPVPIEYRGMIR
jgi:hypothetical protein